MLRAIGVGSVAVLAGCASLAPLDNPVLVRPAASDPLEVENPVLVSPGQPDAAGYAEVFERTIEVLDDYFPLKPTARYAGYIESYPKIAPGYDQAWKPGSPAPRERLLATTQTIRHIAVARITAGERGGYRVKVEIYKELEDLERPMQSRRGAAIFREATTLDRLNEVVSAQTPLDFRWIPAGRDYAFEQLVLRQIQERGPCQ